MARKLRRTLVFLCLAALLLPACQKEEAPDITESLVWETMPTLTYGVWESEKLSVEPWYSGRAEAVSHNTVSETADGYYCTYFSRLYYADKAQPNLWVPVCNKPECTHVSLTTCNACLVTGNFLIHDGRIYFEELAGKNPHLYSKLQSDFILVSTQKDGSDKQFAYAIEDEQLSSDSAGGGSTLLTPTMWLYTTAEFGTDGSITTRVYKVDEKGQQLILNEESDAENTSSGWLGGLYGDRYYQVSAMSTDCLLRFEDSGVSSLEISLIPENRGYVSDEVIRYFVPNDGYFDRNIKTGEEVKLASAQMENSNALIVLPNCIVESTLLTEMSNEVPVEHAMKVFDGNAWHTVNLPKELQKAQNMTLVLKAITSDSIFFCHTKKVTVVIDEKTYDYNDMILYRIPIGAEKWNLEYYGTLEQPR